MRPAVQKHSIIVNGHKTSLSLEAEFYTAFKAIATRRNMTLSTLAAEVEMTRAWTNANLSSAARLFVLADLQAQIKVGQKQTSNLSLDNLVAMADR